MSLRDEIRQFLDEIDPKILARGKDYFRSGRVEHIEWDDECVTAEVSGSEEEPYLVEISLSEDGGIEDWSCDCPYDWGDVCKHMAAVLLALQTEEKPPHREKPEKISVQKLVEQASREQLAALVLEHCREDRRFKGRVLSALENTNWRPSRSLSGLPSGRIHTGAICKVTEDMRNESLKEGIRQGREQGVKEGKRENMKATAERMMADGTLALEKIAEYVGLSIDEIKKLQAGQGT